MTRSYDTRYNSRYYLGRQDVEIKAKLFVYILAYSRMKHIGIL